MHDHLRLCLLLTLSLIHFFVILLSFDPLPHLISIKVKSVLNKLEVTLFPEHAEQLENACATWTNTGEQKGRQKAVVGGG